MYCYYLFALRNKRFHQYNRWYLLSAVALSFVIPLIKIEFWKETQQSTAMKVVTIVYEADAYVAKNTSVWNSDNIAFGVFGFISFVFLSALIFSLIKIFVLIKRYPKTFWENICFVFSNTPGTPYSFFKYIFWNKEIDAESSVGQHILKHEVAHVQEKHSADKLFLSLMLVVGWCNPFLWLMRKELNMIHEFIADQKAVSDGDAHSFAIMLLKTAYPAQTFMPVNSFFHSPIKRRLIMLTTSKNTSFTYLRRLAILPLLVIVFGLFAFTLQKVKQPSSASKTNVSYSIAKKNIIQSLKNGEQFFEKIVDKGFQDTTLKKKHENEIKGSIDNSVHITVTDANGSLEVVGSNKKFGYKDSLRIGKALVVLDGKYITQEELNRDVEPGQIKLMNVLKGEAAIKKYGEKGENGVIEIITFSSNEQSASQQLYVKEYQKFNENQQQSVKEQQKLKENQRRYLEEQSKYNNAQHAALQQYTKDQRTFEGNKQKYLQDQSKYNKAQQEALQQYVKNQQTFTENKQKYLQEQSKYNNTQLALIAGKQVAASETDEDAQFPGGADAWRRYLEKNLNVNVLAKNGAPAGQYPVKLTFHVSADGTVSNVVAKTTNGYGSEEEAIRFIKQGPKWVPAKKDGSFVDSEVNQFITFMVTEK